MSSTYLKSLGVTTKPQLLTVPKPFNIGSYRTQEKKCWINVWHYAQEHPELKPVFAYQLFFGKNNNFGGGLEVVLHAVLLDESGKIVEVTPDRVEKRWMVVVDHSIDFYTAYAYVHRKRPLLELNDMVHEFGWQHAFANGLHYSTLSHGEPNTLLVQMLTKKQNPQMITIEELKAKVIFQYTISQSLKLLVVWCGLYAYNFPKRLVSTMSLSLPTCLESLIAEFHCYLPQDQREALAAQPHILELKTIVRTEQTGWFSHNTIVQWRDHLGGALNNLWLTVILNREGKWVQQGDSDEYEESFWTYRFPSILRRRNVKRWSDGHFHFGYESSN